MKCIIICLSLFSVCKIAYGQSCAFGNVCGDGYCCKYSSGCECSHVVCHEMCFHGDSMPNEIVPIVKDRQYTNQMYGQPVVSTDGTMDDLEDLVGKGGSGGGKKKKKKGGGGEEEEEEEDADLGAGKNGGDGLKEEKQIKKKKKHHHKKRKHHKKSKAKKNILFLMKSVSSSGDSKTYSMSKKSNKESLNSLLKGVNVIPFLPNSRWIP